MSALQTAPRRQGCWDQTHGTCLQKCPPTQIRRDGGPRDDFLLCFVRHLSISMNTCELTCRVLLLKDSPSAGVIGRRSSGSSGSRSNSGTGPWCNPSYQQEQEGPEGLLPATRHPGSGGGACAVVQRKAAARASKSVISACACVPACSSCVLFGCESAAVRTLLRWMRLRVLPCHKTPGNFLASGIFSAGRIGQFISA